MRGLLFLLLMTCLTAMSAQTYEVSYIDTFQVFDSGVRATTLDFEISITDLGDERYQASFNRPMHQVFYEMRSYSEMDKLNGLREYSFEYRLEDQRIIVEKVSSARSAAQSLLRKNRKFFSSDEWKAFKDNIKYYLNDDEDFYKNLTRELYEIHKWYFIKNWQTGVRQIDEFHPEFTPKYVFDESMQRLIVQDKRESDGVQSFRELKIRTVPGISMSRKEYERLKSKFLSNEFDIHQENGTHFHYALWQKPVLSHLISQFEHTWRYRSVDPSVEMFKYSSCTMRLIN